MNVIRDWAALIGRALIAFVFIPAGYSMIGGFAGGLLAIFALGPGRLSIDGG